jgi:hypothetical protein
MAGSLCKSQESRATSRRSTSIRHCWRLNCRLGVRSVTLVLTVNGPETLWMVADRRLSYDGRPPSDFARKVMVLETTDGLAILGYAGLGATAQGNQPADWMSAVLRGINAPLEQSLGIIADAKSQAAAVVGSVKRRKNASPSTAASRRPGPSKKRLRVSVNDC